VSIRLLHLFPEALSASGDSGNIQTVEYRLRERGQGVEIVAWSGEGDLPLNVDAVFIGNGPWSAASRALPLLVAQAGSLRTLVDSGAIVFAVGTGAELLAKSVTDGSGTTHAGLGIFGFSVRREADRRVGYMRVASSSGELIGFGDFASVWTLEGEGAPLGNAVVGDRPSQVFVEGCISGVSIATRLGGPALPLNPALADELVSRIAHKHGISVTLGDLPVDEYAARARALIVKNLDSVFTTIAL
jgi:CobQ-like glutamine amidotransferase family enzyme